MQTHTRTHTLSLSLSLLPRPSAFNGAARPPICAARGPPQPLNLNLPALLVYKYRFSHTGKSWSSENAQGCSRTSPFRLIPPSSFLCFLKKTSRVTTTATIITHSHAHSLFFPPFCFFPNCTCFSAASCMHFSSPKMVCETKIVADEHDAIPGTKKESIMWSSPPPPPPAAPAAPAAAAGAPSGAALNPAEATKDARKDAVFIREFERGDQQEVRRIFYEGIMERIPNTAFRGLRQQPKTQFLYALLTGKPPSPHLHPASCIMCQTRKLPTLKLFAPFSSNLIWFISGFFHVNQTQIYRFSAPRASAGDGRLS